MDAIIAKEGTALELEQAYGLIAKLLEERKPQKVLLVPPDITRKPSMAGPLTAYAYRYLDQRGIPVDVIPALGSHVAMSEEEFTAMFAGIPYDKMIVHNWRNDTVTLGEVSGEFIHKVSGGRLSYSIPVQVNKVLYGGYDLILSLGQVVPHEVVGMANYSKNIFVGLGGREMIDKTHFLSAVWGIENTLGEVDTPVRAVFDYAHKRFLSDLPITFLLSVVGDDGLAGVFISDKRDAFEEAAKLSAELNVKTIEPVDVAVCYMDPEEYKTTWLSNKAVYRTRCAIKDNGTLYVLAPAVKNFGEDKGIDALIRKYGYVDFKSILKAAEQDEDVKNSLSAAAHLIHGSSDGRFKIIYCVKDISHDEIRSVNYDVMNYDVAAAIFDGLKRGVNIIDGKRVLYTDRAALELWKVK